MNRLLISDSFNNAEMYYVTKVLVPDPFVYISTKKKNYILANSLEFERIKKEVGNDIEVINLESYKEKSKAKFKRVTISTITCLFLKEKNIKSVYVTQHLPIIYADFFRKYKINVKVKDPFIDRSIKTQEEIQNIANVQTIVDKALQNILQIIKDSTIKNNLLYYQDKPLTSEYLRQVMETFLIANNIESPEGIIISSGKATAYPHELGSGPIETGVPIIIDIYPRSRVSRYFSDMTRTVCKGQPKNPKIQEIYNIVLEAQKAAYKKIKPGISAKKVHETVVSTFKKYKMEKYFIHSTGHGVGLALHEDPRIPDKKILKEGMIITNEPGLYIPDLGGVRIEDILLVTKTGYKILSKSPKEFIIN